MSVKEVIRALVPPILYETAHRIKNAANDPAPLPRSKKRPIARNGHNYKIPGHVISRPELFDLLSKRYELFASWNFESHLVEMGTYDSPALLWKRSH